MSTKKVLNKEKAIRILFRILLCPFIFLWGIFLLLAGTLFPITLLVIYSFYGLMMEPLVWILNKSGSKVKGLDPFIDNFGNDGLGHFLGLTIHIWGAFAVVYIYLKDGTIFVGEEITFSGGNV